MVVGCEVVLPQLKNGDEGSAVKNVSFAFIPENTTALEKYLFKEEDTTFFVLGDTLISDLPDILSFPALIHA